MITVQQATEIINQVPFRPATGRVKLADATGRVLAETIAADRDLPPFHRATMDGIAIKFAEGIVEFTLEGIQAAGQPQKKLGTGCIEIMTGAVLPEGADTVVRYEDVRIENGKAFITSVIEKGQSVHQKGIDARKNDILLEPGILISPAEASLLASVGKSEVLVAEVPVIAIVTTGDELIPVEETPLPYQVRRSNDIALGSCLQLLNIKSVVTHLPDDKEILESKLREIIAGHDIVILSGGVSKGKFDFIPAILEELGINKLFHQVRQRPGKPFWFGRSKTKTVFALPGNPVSTFLCFHRYIKPWLEEGMGIKQRKLKAILSKDFIFKPDLTYFLQVRIDTSEGIISAIPDAGEGSGDFVNLKDVDGFIELPSQLTEFKKGEAFTYISFRR